MKTCKERWSWENYPEITGLRKMLELVSLCQVTETALTLLINESCIRRHREDCSSWRQFSFAKFPFSGQIIVLYLLSCAPIKSNHPV
jgi:hypothetical protein